MLQSISHDVIVLLNRISILMSGLENRLTRLLRSDSYLTPFSDQIRTRLENIEETEHLLTQGKKSLAEFASGHEYFGLHFQSGEWVFREWAPNATAIYLIGDMSKWQESKEVGLKRFQALSLPKIFVMNRVCAFALLSPLKIWSLSKPLIQITDNIREKFLKRLAQTLAISLGILKLPGFCLFHQDICLTIYCLQLWKLMM